MSNYRGSNERPKVKIEYTFVEILVELIALAALVFSFGLVIKNWSSLPTRIPTNFGYNGKPDGWGSKGTLWILPSIILPMYLGLTVLSRYPHTYNYIVKITMENAKKQYHTARKMINLLKVEIMLIFAYIEYQSIRSAKGLGMGLGAGFIVIVLIVVFGTVGYFIFKQVKYKE